MKTQKNDKINNKQSTISYKGSSWRRQNLSIDIKHCDYNESKNESDIYNEIKDINLFRDLISRK